MSEKERVDTNIRSAYRLLHPLHTVLISCMGITGKPNIMALAWITPTSMSPPLVALVIRPTRLSHALITETKEFVINIPTTNILKETLFCGRVSGRQHDKFKETGLTPLPARRVKPPIIKECVAHLECRLHSQFTTGDHTVFIGEVVDAYADRGAFNARYDLKNVNMIFHLGGDEFATMKNRVLKPKL
jgi:flavin reductase (DIM6/NTAB) family NADH-FMN oxidoreductase RutF